MVNPPLLTEDEFDVGTALRCYYPSFPPYGLGLLCSVLKSRGYETDIVDLNYEILKSVHDDPEAFEFSVWKSILRERIESWKPDLLGVSCMFSLTHHSMLATAAWAKEVNPSLPVVLGGVHATEGAPHILAEHPWIDFILRFEADNALAAMIDFVNGKVDTACLSQIATMANGEYHYIEKRDVPAGDALNTTPAFHALPIGNYSAVGRLGAYHFLRPDKPKTSTMLANRGCRAHCTFCSVASFNGKGVRGRDVTSAVNEMQMMKEVYGIEHFMFLDDDLFNNREGRIVRFFNEIVRRKLNITWDASNGVIASATTEEIVAAAAASGCIGLTLGIESGNPEILRAIQKPSGVRHFHNAAAILAQYPEIYSKGFLMVGFENETIGQVWDTIRLAQELNLDRYPIQILTLFVGTALGEGAVKRGEVEASTIIDARFFQGSTGIEHQREKTERESARRFEDLLAKPTSYLPTKEEVPDLWFIMNYLVNYEPVLRETDIAKLTKKRNILVDMCHRTNPPDPLAHLFLGIANIKLGLQKEAGTQFTLAKQFMEESAFWTVRFAHFKLDRLLRESVSELTQH
jgi:radical SAM superfamily enzyme YgiQ (UPF0313 family)